MKNLILIALLASVSNWSVADHHGGPDNGRKGGLFKHVDTDADGSISSEEHEAAIAKMAEQRRNRFMDMDADGNGSVTKEEAKAMQKKRKKTKEKYRPRDKAMD